jgi:hypothetical protein
MHAQTTHHSQRDAQAPDSLAGSGRLSLPAADTCCHSCSFARLGMGCAVIRAGRLLWTQEAAP